ncbi:MAG: hypothetical protein HW389_3869 [Bacteroidetes bacterium]|nr:hypothetical protein [Bacteroidota bacterium]
MEKKALGRGLDALLPATKPASMPSAGRCDRAESVSAETNVFSSGTGRTHGFIEAKWVAATNFSAPQG